MMARYRLSRDIELRFRDAHTVRAKAGRPVMFVPGGSSGFAISPGVAETDSPRGRGSLWAHDTTYFFIWVPADAVEKVESDA